MSSASSTFSNDFSSETPGPTSIKFHIKHPGNGRFKICSNGPGLMAKMAAISETLGLFKTNLHMKAHGLKGNENLF